MLNTQKGSDTLMSEDDSRYVCVHTHLQMSMQVYMHVGLSAVTFSSETYRW
jgi:hypothetical protein